MSYTSKNATHPDLEKIAACHMLAFPDSVPVLLGKSFVVEMLQWYLSAPNKFLFWIEENNQCIGYCGGYVKNEQDAYGAASGMTQFGFNAAIKAMIKRPWLAFHPEIRSRYAFVFTNVKRKLFRKKYTQTSSTSKPVEHTVPLKTAGLIVIGVHPNWQKKGLGSLLQQEFEKKAIDLHAEMLQLSVRKNNAQAISSYQRNGWHIAEEQTISYIMKKSMMS
jgi:ribosomal protein S18 acetylase RimI-like enzyme